MRWMLVVSFLVASCSSSRRDPNGNGDGGGGSDASQPTCPVCSNDHSAVIDCNGNATQCPLDQTCSAGACVDGCAAATANHASVGCDYYAVDMDATWGAGGGCYTVFVANTSRDAAHVAVEWNGQSIDLSKFAKLPVGSGTSLTYGSYDPVAGLAPNQVAILFLSNFPSGNILAPSVTCPVPAALGAPTEVVGSGIGNAFHVTTDRPVVAYQMLPYGGGLAATTGASLLLPTSAWDVNYVAVEGYDTDPNAPQLIIGVTPSFDVVAQEDGTTVTIRPTHDIVATGTAIPAGPANQPYTVMLDKGQYLQLTEKAQLSGSPVTANKPVGVFGGNEIVAIDICCGDHAEQMLAPARALGFTYVAAPHGDRRPTADPRVFRIYGAVDGTQLTYDPPGIGPPDIGLGGMAEIRSDTPFVVTSQDAAHPFSFFTYMTGAGEMGQGGWGDADFVREVPPAQFLDHYVFFTDVTYPFTTLTVVRQKNAAGTFDDVQLDCLGAVSGWQDVGQFQIAYVKLVDHFNAQGACNNGVHTMGSATPFGVWVWGWGSEDTSTGWVSYGYPAGEAVMPINDVIIF